MSSKKRVGILTLSLHENYGGNLQAFALQKVLQKLGFETILINRQPNRLEYKKIQKPFILKELAFGKRFWKKLDNRKRILKENRVIKDFILQNITPQTEVLDREEMMENITHEYSLDAIVVGSDQVWKPSYSGSYTKNLFLDFVKEKNIKKITYAASFGGNQWEYPQQLTAELTNLLQSFDAVSVREDAAVNLARKTFGVNAVQLVDPTLLLDKEEYRQLIDQAGEGRFDKPFLLTYILDPTKEKEEIIAKVAEERELPVESIANRPQIFGRTVYGKKRTKFHYPSVPKWLQGFDQADFIVTDSFHGVAFSILFNKPFIAIGNKQRGVARFQSILNLFGLKNRLILSYSELSNDLIHSDSDFNYQEINLKVQQEKEKSFDFLSKSLG